MMRALVLAALALVLGGCLSMHPRMDAEPSPVFRPEVFFGGETEGRGTLAVRASGTRLVRVRSYGETLPDDTSWLDQTITIGDGEPTTRMWTLARTASGYTSTLTDADGPVEVEVYGSELRVRYSMGGSLSMHQSLYLQPGGKTVLNLSTVRFLGIPIARLTEHIRRLPSTA